MIYLIQYTIQWCQFKIKPGLVLIWTDHISYILYIGCPRTHTSCEWIIKRDDHYWGSRIYVTYCTHNTMNYLICYATDVVKSMHYHDTYGKHAFEYLLNFIIDRSQKVKFFCLFVFYNTKEYWDMLSANNINMQRVCDISQQ